MYRIVHILITLFLITGDLGISRDLSSVGKCSFEHPECKLRRRCSQGQRRMPLRKYHHDTLDQLLTNCNARAMRYYRIWIYTCNAVLFLSVMIFCAVAGRVLVADYRRYLIPNLALYQPSFLYAYLALFTQSGVLQVYIKF